LMGSGKDIFLEDTSLEFEHNKFVHSYEHLRLQTSSLCVLSGTRFINRSLLSYHKLIPRLRSDSRRRPTTTNMTTPTALMFKNGYIVDTDCEIEMRCHDRQFRDTVFLDSSGAEIFALDCPPLFTSWTMRRTLRDAAGLQVLQIRHAATSLLENWIIEDAHGKQLCTAKGSKAPRSGGTVITVKVLRGDGAEVGIDIRSGDHAGTSTTFRADGVTIGEMLLVTNNDLSLLGRRGLDRSGWTLKVKADTDLALIAALAVCRAEVLHAWRR
jgi:hypothetical protein